MKIALRIAGIVALLLLMAKPSIYMYWEPSVARSQFLLFKNVAMLFLATLWYLDATRKYFESSVVASTSVVFLPLIALFLEMNDYLQLDLPEEEVIVPEGHALAC